MTFEETQTKVQVIKWYSITGAEPMLQKSNSTQILPLVAKFTFEDGDCKDIFITGKVVRKDGSTGAKWQAVVDIYTWDVSGWPEWLHDLYAKVLSSPEVINPQLQASDTVVEVRPE